MSLVSCSSHHYSITKLKKHSCCASDSHPGPRNGSIQTDPPSYLFLFIKYFLLFDRQIPAFQSLSLLSFTLCWSLLIFILSICLSHSIHLCVCVSISFLRCLSDSVRLITLSGLICFHSYSSLNNHLNSVLCLSLLLFILFTNLQHTI